MGEQQQQKRSGVAGGSGENNNKSSKNIRGTGCARSESLLTDEVELDDDDDGVISDEENDLLPAMLVGGLNCSPSTRIGMDNRTADSGGALMPRWRHELRQCAKRVSMALGCCAPWAGGFTQFK